MTELSSLSKYIAIWMVSVFISSVAQVMLKAAANRTYDRKIKEYLNPIVITAYGIFFASTPADYVRPEICAPDHVSHCGVMQLYFCPDSGYFYSEREDQQKKMAGDGHYGGGNFYFYIRRMRGI